MLGECQKLLPYVQANKSFNFFSPCLCTWVLTWMKNMHPNTMVWRYLCKDTAL